MGLVRPTIAADAIHPLPMVTASADTIGLVEAIQAVGPTALPREPGTMVLGMLLETCRGRRPLSRLAACLTPHETTRLLGQAVAPGPPPLLWGLASWRNGPGMAGAGPAPSSRARSTPCARGSRRPADPTRSVSSVW